MGNKIKAVFLDIDNTLLDFQKSAKKAIDMSFEMHSFPQPEDFFEIFKRINDVLWKKIELCQMTFDDLVKTRFDIMFKEANVPLDGYEFELSFRKNLFHSAEKVVGAEEMLEFLSEKYLVFAASNGLQKQQENRLEIAGLLPFVNDVFTSERMGASKPNPDFFKGCFDLLDGIKPENAIIIGDSLTSDIKGGKDFGISTCWFNYQNEDNHLGVEPDHTIYSLDEITKIL